jgi:hypothetical protein
MKLTKSLLRQIIAEKRKDLLAEETPPPIETDETPAEFTSGAPGQAKAFKKAAPQPETHKQAVDRTLNVILGKPKKPKAAQAQAQAINRTATQSDFVDGLDVDPIDERFTLTKSQLRQIIMEESAALLEE